MGGDQRAGHSAGREPLGPEFIPDKSRTAFLDIARALAAILVVYTHIYNVFIREHKGVHTPPTDALDNALVIPLRLDDQGIGALSVPIFFIISGFVVTPIALKMGSRNFGVNRLVRIFPLLIFVVAVSAVLVAFGRGLLSTRPPDVTVTTFLSNVSLWNFIDRPFGAWVAVAWTLAVEILFYAMLIAVLPLLRTRIWLAISVQLWLVLMLLITYRAFGDEYRAFVINMTYTLIPIMGQAIWAAWTRKIPAWLAGVFVTVAWLMFVWAGHLKVDPDYIPRPFPIAFALMLFLLGLFAEPYLKQRRFWTELSERTYSIYLLHGSVAFPLMHWLFNTFPLWLTVLVAVVATALAAEVSYRFIERPSHNLARRLSRRREREPEPVEDEYDDDEYDDDEYEEDYDDYEDEDPPDGADAPTEKTPPVAPPRRTARPIPNRPPTPAEVKTEKIEPVSRPLRRPRDPDANRPTRLTPVVRAWPTDDEPAPRRRPGPDAWPTEDEPAATNGTRRDDRPDPDFPARTGRPRVPALPSPNARRDRETNEPRGRPTPTRREPAPEPNGLPARNGRERDLAVPDRPEPNGLPARNGRRRLDEVPPRPEPTHNGHHTGHQNGSRLDPEVNGRGGRRRAEDILNGEVPEGSGGRRRAEEPADPTRFVSAGSGARRVEPNRSRTASSVAWPGEQEDPDEARPVRGRHRSD